MDLFIIITLLVIVSAVYSYINARFIKLPGTIGVITIAILFSVATIIIDRLNPGVARYLTALAKHIDFSGTVLNIMLGFLLFAGSFNLNTRRLKKEMVPVLVLSTLGVILSTAIFGTLFYYVAMLVHVKIGFVYCLLFGALISPTDPVAVGAIIKGSKLPQNLATIIAGESLFNDGVGLVLFITLLELTESGTDHVDFAKTALLFAREVFGGIAFGMVSGYLAFRLMRSITDFQTIVLVSLALVMGVSVIASAFHLSIPLAVVAAGLVMGNQSINIDSTEHSHQALEKFWQLIDELSLPFTPYRHIILSGSYFIVIFSIIVQGLSLNRVINAAYKE